MNIADQATQIIEHLPGTWTVKNAHHWIVTIERDDRTKLMIKSADRDRRLEISIPLTSHVNPRGGTDYLHADHRSITAAVSRGPEAIASDITAPHLARRHRVQDQGRSLAGVAAEARRRDRRRTRQAPRAARRARELEQHDPRRKIQRRSLQRQLCHRRIGALTIDQALAVATGPGRCLARPGPASRPTPKGLP